MSETERQAILRIRNCQKRSGVVRNVASPGSGYDASLGSERQAIQPRDCWARDDVGEGFVQTYDLLDWRAQSFDKTQLYYPRKLSSALKRPCRP